MRQRFGRQDDHHRSNMDWVEAVNEDLGLNANLVTTTNDTFETTIPYPQDWDPTNEVMTIYKILFELLSVAHVNTDGFALGLSSSLSMIDRAATATYRGAGTDGNDEWQKSTFVSHMYSGRTASLIADSTSNDTYVGWSNTLVMAEYVPSVPIPAFFPVYLEYWGQGAVVAEATGVTTDATFTGFEQTGLNYDYTIRKMSRSEQRMFEGIPGMQQRWAALGS